MKKNYIAPVTEITEIALEQMVAASSVTLGIGVPIESGQTVTADSKSDGNLWDEEW